MDNDDVKRLFIKLDKIDDRLDTIDGRLSSIDVTQAKQEIHLEEHIRRTALAEHNIEANRIKQENDIKSVKNEIKPLQRSRTMVVGCLKLLGLLGVLATVISSVLAAIQYIKTGHL